jgi:hypothetical protein
MTQKVPDKTAARRLQAICDAERTKLGLGPVPYRRCLNLVREHWGQKLTGQGAFAERLFDAHREALLRP